MSVVTMTCMTTKKKFECVDPPCIMLANGRYAYRVKCPWEGKNGKQLFAFKFCSAAAYKQQSEPKVVEERPESPNDVEGLLNEEEPDLEEEEQEEHPESPERED